jgi:hypothetical protein
LASVIQDREIQYLITNKKKPGERTARRIVAPVAIARKVTEALLIL